MECTLGIYNNAVKFENGTIWEAAMVKIFLIFFWKEKRSHFPRMISNKSDITLL